MENSNKKQNPDAPAGQLVQNKGSPSVWDETDAVILATKALRTQLNAQEDRLNLLFECASKLEVASKKTHSATVSTAIGDLLEAVTSLKNGRVELNGAFNRSQYCVHAHEVRKASSTPLPASKTVETQTTSQHEEPTRCICQDENTDTPCWWYAADGQQHSRLQQRTTVQSSVDRNIVTNGSEFTLV